MKYKCPCCGNYTLNEFPKGTFEICPVCYYEIDFDFEGGGANVYPIDVCRENYKKYGASNLSCVELVRKPLSEEIPENNDNVKED